MYKAQHWLLMLFWGACFASACGDLAALPSSVHIKSLRQKNESNHELVFWGDVDCLLKKRAHIAADRLFFDTKKQFLRAESTGLRDVVLQDNKIVAFAQRFSFDVATGEITARDARVQMAEGFFTAQELCCDEHGTWWAKQVVYTPCDAHAPHWQVKAAEMVYSTSYLELDKIKFLINTTPLVWAPRIVVPLQKKGQSGFLVPKFSLDYRKGPGLRQDYYWYIHEHADLTTGIDWKNGRGFFGTGEVRWAQSPQLHGHWTGYGGYADQVYVQRRDSIVRTSQPQFWIQGKHAYGVDHAVGFDSLAALAFVDYGVDKKVGYEFFDRLEDVDDTSYNGFLVRGYAQRGVLQLACDGAQTTRKRFFVVPVEKFFSAEEQAAFVLDKPARLAVQEVDSRSSVQHLPQVAWTGLLRQMGNVSYKDRWMADYAAMRDQETELVFLQEKLAREERITPRATANALRAAYSGDLALQLPLPFGTIVAACSPHLQVRSIVNSAMPQPSQFVYEQALFGKGACRALLMGEASFTPPQLEVVNVTDERVATMQTMLYGHAVPFTVQQGWVLFDKFDRYYPTGEVGVRSDYALYFGEDHGLRGHVMQGYDCIPQSLWFGPRQGGAGYRLTPCAYGATYQVGEVACSFEQEFCFLQQKLLTSFVHAKTKLGEADLHVGYLFQDGGVARLRRLLAPAPHSFFLQATMPIGRGVSAGYKGFFVAERSVVGWGRLRLTPIKHEVRLEYRGHCWGLYFGIEEKLYRQHGYEKHDRAFVLSVYADSLGSFAKKIKSNDNQDSGLIFK